jgi:hypothetical protein
MDGMQAPTPGLTNRVPLRAWYLPKSSIACILCTAGKCRDRLATASSTWYQAVPAICRIVARSDGVVLRSIIVTYDKRMCSAVCQQVKLRRVLVRLLDLSHLAVVSTCRQWLPLQFNSTDAHVCGGEVAR